MRVLDGRYGPYVTDGETNATVPKDESPDSMTMARALEPIEARDARAPAKKKGRRSAGAKKAPARKKCAPRSNPCGHRRGPTRLRVCAGRDPRRRLSLRT